MEPGKVPGWPGAAELRADVQREGAQQPPSCAKGARPRSAPQCGCSGPLAPLSTPTSSAASPKARAEAPTWQPPPTAPHPRRGHPQPSSHHQQTATSHPLSSASAVPELLKSAAAPGPQPRPSSPWSTAQPPRRTHPTAIKPLALQIS